MFIKMNLIDNKRLQPLSFNEYDELSVWEKYFLLYYNKRMIEIQNEYTEKKMKDFDNKK